MVQRTLQMLSDKELVDIEGVHLCRWFLALGDTVQTLRKCFEARAL